MNPESYPQQNTELEAQNILQIEANNKLDEISNLQEANILSNNEVKKSVDNLEPVLDVIALNTQPKEVQKVELLGAEIVTIKGQKGDKGDTPKKGRDYFTRDEIEDIKNSVRENLKKEVTPIKGDDYFTKKEIDEIVNDVFSKIPKPKDGKTPIKGVDYFTPEEIKNLIYDVLIRIPEPQKIDEQKLINKVIKSLPKLPEVKLDTADQIADKLNTLTKKIDWKVLKNIPDMTRKIPGGGGGQDITVEDDGVLLTSVLKKLSFVGAGVTLNQLSDGVIVVTIPGGSGVANIKTEPVTATQNGTSVDIDLTQLSNPYTEIQFVSRNGQIQSPANWSIVGDVLTLVNASAGNAFVIQYSY